MVVKHACGICKRAVAINHRPIECGNCGNWIHVRCNLLDKITYKKLKQDTHPWFCLTCTRSIMPFSDLTDLDFNLAITGKNLSIVTDVLDCSDHYKSLFK